MAKTLDDGFQLFIDSLTPDNSLFPVSDDYRDIIWDCLDSNFGLYALFLAGSLQSNTNMRGHGGVDYFASVDEREITGNSNEFLERVAQALSSCFLDVTARAPAVEIPFGDRDEDVIRVVPARLGGETATEHRFYGVADGVGGWMNASPDAHATMVETLDESLAGMFRPLIRLLKAWKHYRQVPVSSFYLELRCVEYAYDEKAIAYTVDFPSVLQTLWDDQFADVHDPKGVAGIVPARLTPAKKKDAISKLRTALYHTSRAQEAEAEWDIEEAFVYWNRVFKGHFSAYG